ARDRVGALQDQSGRSRPGNRRHRHVSLQVPTRDRQVLGEQHARRPARRGRGGGTNDRFPGVARRRLDLRQRDQCRRRPRRPPAAVSAPRSDRRRRGAARRGAAHMITDPALPLIPGDEELHIRESVRGICASFGPRYARQCYEQGKPPSELWEALSDKGFVGANIPAEWGGGGMGMSGLQIVAEEASAAGVGLLMLVVSPGICGSILNLRGSEEQKERWL